MKELTHVVGDKILFMPRAKPAGKPLARVTPRITTAKIRAWAGLDAMDDGDDDNDGEEAPSNSARGGREADDGEEDERDDAEDIDDGDD